MSTVGFVVQAKPSAHVNATVDLVFIGAIGHRVTTLGLRGGTSGNLSCSPTVLHWSRGSYAYILATRGVGETAIWC